MIRTITRNDASAPHEGVWRVGNYIVVPDRRSAAATILDGMIAVLDLGPRRRRRRVWQSTPVPSAEDALCGDMKRLGDDFGVAIRKVVRQRGKEE